MHNSALCVQLAYRLSGVLNFDIQYIYKSLYILISFFIHLFIYFFLGERKMKQECSGRDEMRMFPSAQVSFNSMYLAHLFSNSYFVHDN